MKASDERLPNAIHCAASALARLAAFLAWTLVVVPPYAALLGLGRVALCRRIARGYWQGATLVLGIQVTVRGAICPERPALFVANHASYLDIVVLGSLLPAAFVAKKEVGQWPGIGVLAKLGRTVFVDRRPRKSLDQRDEMMARLTDAAESLVLFPEGTSNDGNRVLPFKSALFSVAESRSTNGRALPVQPVSIAYTRLDGLPIGHAWRPFYAWYGDMELAPHLWTVLGLGRLTVEVEFHPTVALEQFVSRRALADHCHQVIRAGVARANAGSRVLPGAPVETVIVG